MSEYEYDQVIYKRQLWMPILLTTVNGANRRSPKSDDT